MKYDINATNRGTNSPIVITLGTDTGKDIKTLERSNEVISRRCSAKRQFVLFLGFPNVCEEHQCAQMK